MLCKYPYCRKPTGEIRVLSKINPDARLAVTPFPCGQCLHCRINQSMVWSTRIKLERDLWPDSIFVTLTYNDEHLPIINNTNSLSKEDYTNFLKRLRQNITPRRIRTIGVGEYGPNTNRPHYHLIIFNSKPGDETHIENAWSKEGEPMGFVDTSILTDARANYIAGYVVDKLLDRGKIDSSVERPFMRSSKGSTKNICAKFKGGIGAGYAYYVAWQLKNNKQEWLSDEEITNMVYGPKKMPLGRYIISLISWNSGIDENVFKIKNEVYYDELLDKIYEQCKKDQEKPEKSPYKKEGKEITYYDSIRARTKQQRLVREKRHKIFTSRNQI